MAKPLPDNLPARRRRSAFSPRDVLYVLFRHKRKALLAFAFVAALGALAAALLPDEYESEAKLSVRLGRESVSLDPTASIGQTALPMQNRDNELNSEVELLASRAVATAVAEEVGAARITGDDEATVAEAADELQSDVAASVLPDTNYLYLSYSAATPELARDVVAAYIEYFGRTRTRVYRNESGADFFRDQRRLAADELAALRGELQHYKDTTGIADVTTQRQILLARIGDLEAAIDAAGADKAAAEATANGLAERLDAMPEQVVSARTTGAPNSSIETLRTRLSELRLEERDLSSRYVESSPTVRTVRGQIAEAERLLADAEAAAEETTSVNPVREQLAMRVETERANAAAQAAKLERLTTDLATAKSGLARLNDAQVVIGDLERRADLAESNLRKYAEQYEVARIDRALEEGNISNIRVVDAANLPDEPSGPNRPILLLASLVMATLAAGAAAFAADALDHTVARPDDLLRLDGDAAARAADSCVSIPRLRSGQAVAKGTADYFDDLVHSVATVFGTAGQRGTDVAAGTRRQARGFLASSRYIAGKLVVLLVRLPLLALLWLGNAVVTIVQKPFKTPKAKPTRADLFRIAPAGARLDDNGGLSLDAADERPMPLSLDDDEIQDQDPDERRAPEPLAAPPRRLGRSVRLVAWAVARDARAWWHRDERPNLQLMGRGHRTAASAAVWRSARGLVEQIILAAEADGRGNRVPATVAVVAARPNSGTSMVAAHVAGVLAERVLDDGEHRDADRRPALLLEVVDAAEPRDAVVDGKLTNVEKTPAAGLDRLRVDSGRTADVRRALDAALARYKHVVLDVPPLYADPDADGRSMAHVASEETGPRLASLCETTALVMNADRLRREAAGRALDRLAHAGARVDVVVLNRRGYPVPRWLYRRA